jgi:uncharacterized protein
MAHRTSPRRAPRLSSTTTTSSSQTSFPRTLSPTCATTPIELNVVDPFVRKGYRFKGTADIHEAGEAYDRGLEVLRERGYNTDTVKHIVLVTVERALPLVSPVYSTGASESEVQARWARHFAAQLAAAESDS